MPTYSIQELEHTLRGQIAWRSPEMPPEALKLSEQLLQKLPQAVEFDGFPVYVPALLVLPFGLVPFERQLEAVQYSPAGSSAEARPAYSFLKSENVSDLEVAGLRIPSDEPYVLLHVDDGLSMKGDSPQDAGEVLEGLDVPRHPVTVAQGLALTIACPWIFDRHNMYLSGSRIRDERTGEVFVPDFWVYGGQIKMKRDSPTASDPRWATPSWSKIITL